MLNNLKLRAKFNLVLMLIFVVGVALSGFSLSSVLGRSAENEFTSKALILLETMVSVRNYTNNQINPELSPRLETEERFLPQVVAAYSAREVFDGLQAKPEYNNFFYKEAAVNPTNPRDKADDFETKIFEQFRTQTNLKQLTGFRSIASGDVFYVARPLTVPQKSCLQCHSTPEAAPKSMIATYGRENGFNWKLNDLVAVQILSVPANDIIKSSQRSLLWIMAIIMGIFTGAILLVNFLLRVTVIKPLKQMSKVAKDISTGKWDEEFEYKSADEIGVLAASFNRMKVSLKMAMNMLNEADN